MTRCSTTSSMNSKLSNKFRINAKLRKKHFMFRTCSFTGRALQKSPTALQNHRTTVVLTNSIVMAKPMNNAQQRGGKHANTETCRRNGRIAKWEDKARQRPKTFNHQCCHLRRSPDWALTFTSKTFGRPDYQHRSFIQTQFEDTQRTSGS